MSATYKREYLAIPENKEKHAKSMKKYYDSKPKNYKLILPLSGMNFRTFIACSKYLKENLELDTIIDDGHPLYLLLCDLINHRNKTSKKVKEFTFITQNGKNGSPSLDRDLRRGEKYRPHLRYEGEKEWRTFSLKKCLTQSKTSNDIDCVSKAMRNEIDEQILIYRRLHPCCSKCKDKSFDKLEVNHIIPFCKLRDDFLIENQDLDLSLLKVGTKYYFLSGETSTAWKKSHQELAKLETLCQSCHRE